MRCQKISRKSIIKALPAISILATITSPYMIFGANFSLSQTIAVAESNLVAEKLAQQPNNPKAEAERLMQQGDRFVKARQYTLAATSFEQALAIYRRIKDAQNEKIVTQRLIMTYSQLGADEKMMSLIRQSQVLRSEGSNPDNSDSSESDSSDSELSDSDLGDLSGALALNRLPGSNNVSGSISKLERLLHNSQARGDRKNEASALLLLGMVYSYQQEDYPKAISYYKQSLAKAKEIQDRDLGWMASLALGDAYYQQEDNRQAIAYYEQSLAKVRENPRNQDGEDASEQSDDETQLGSYEAQSLMSVGKAYLSLGDFPKAISYSQQALAKEQEHKDTDEEDKFTEGGALAVMGEALFKSGQLIKAEKTLKSAIQALESSRIAENESKALEQQVKLFEYQAAVALSLQQVFIAQNKPEAALETAEWGRARVFVELLSKRMSPRPQLTARQIAQQQAQQLIGQGTEDTVCQLYDREFLQTLEQQGISPQEAQSINQQAQQAYQQCQRELQQYYQSQEFQQQSQQVVNQLSQTISENPFLINSLQTEQPTTVKPPTLQQIRQIAKEQKATIVEYSIISDNGFTKRQGKELKILIWVIKPTGEVALRQVDLKKQNISLASLVSKWRCFEDDTCRGNVTSTLKSRTSPVRQTYNSAAKQTKPTASSQSQTSELQQLHQLLIQPIADLLPTDTNAHVIFIPHKSLFQVPFAALQDGQGKYLIEKHTVLTAPAIQVLSLTHQKRQRLGTQNLASLKANNSLVVGNPIMPSVGEPPQQLPSLQGAEDEAKDIADLLKSQAIIGNQATKVSLVQKMPQARIIHLATHGLLDDSQGLGIPGAIALAPSGYDNGLLTSSEILDLKLNAELVVLSACNTGSGIITGDGVIGLSRSLISAGVPSVLVSLWSVPDQPTAELMAVFYQKLKTQPNKAQALRQAMQETMKHHPDPEDWAAFTLIGEAF